MSETQQIRFTILEASARPGIRWGNTITFGFRRTIHSPSPSLRRTDAGFACCGLGASGFTAVQVAFCLARNDAVCTNRPDADQRAAGWSGVVGQRLAFVI